MKFTPFKVYLKRGYGNIYSLRYNDIYAYKFGSYRMPTNIFIQSKYLAHSAYLLYVTFYVKEWKQNGSKCYWIKKQIEHFHIHPPLNVQVYIKKYSFKKLDKLYIYTKKVEKISRLHPDLQFVFLLLWEFWFVNSRYLIAEYSRMFVCSHWFCLKLSILKS